MVVYKIGSERLVPAAWVRRGAGVEAVHTAAIAVVDARSRLTHALGDVEQPYFARSSIKPLQALAFVEAGGPARYGFGPQELALCMASHSGTDLHVAVVKGMLQKLGLTPEALQCGAHNPIGLQQAGQVAQQGEDKDPLRHNCSGKHCGFLALAQLLGQPVADYLEPTGPAQLLVRHAVADACAVDVASLIVATDGCSAPNFSLPLRNLAIGFKNLALADDEARTSARQALLEHPVLVSGEGRLDYDLARAFPGRLLVKGGAEAIMLMSFREPALGIAVKVVDGSARALGPIVVETLKQLRLIDDMAKFPSLAPYERPSVENARQLKTGEICADFQLSRF